MPAGTVVALHSGETGQPVVGAVMVLSGYAPDGPVSRTYTSDAAGQIVLERAVYISPAPQLDITAAGFLTRATLLRSDETTLTLWPATSPTGADEQFSATIAYSLAACPAVNSGQSPLRKISASVDTVYVSLADNLLDQGALAAHETAIVRLNDALAGALRYELTAEPPAGAVSFVAHLDPEHATCTAGPEPLRAAASLTFANGNISGGRLSYCNAASARSVPLVLHELGHTLGLYHSASTSDVMYCSGGRPNRFSAREEVVIRLARQRRTGNRWPDNDRLTSAPLAVEASRTEVIACSH